MIQKILRDLYDESGWVIGHADGPLSVKQIGWIMELKAEIVDAMRALVGKEFQMAAPR